MPIVMVDDVQKWPGAKPPFHRGSCHMTVDGDTSEALESLHALAQRIGLRREWFQATRVPHYDLTPEKRAQALANGAVYVNARQQAKARIARRRAC